MAILVAVLAEWPGDSKASATVLDGLSQSNHLHSIRCFVAVKCVVSTRTAYDRTSTPMHVWHHYRTALFAFPVAGIRRIAKDGQTAF
jgi:hypothetical protein